MVCTGGSGSNKSGMCSSKVSIFVKEKTSKVASEALNSGYVKHDLPQLSDDSENDLSCLFNDAVRARPKPEDNE